MSNEHLKRIMSIVHSLDGLSYQLMIHLSSRMTTDLMVARYRLLRSFHEENPAIPLSQAEADSTNSTAPVARVNR